MCTVHSFFLDKKFSSVHVTLAVFYDLQLDYKYTICFHLKLVLIKQLAFHQDLNIAFFRFINCLTVQFKTFTGLQRWTALFFAACLFALWYCIRMISKGHFHAGIFCVTLAFYASPLAPRVPSGSKFPVRVWNKSRGPDSAPGSRLLFYMFNFFMNCTGMKWSTWNLNFKRFVSLTLFHILFSDHLEILMHIDSQKSYFSRCFTLIKVII